MVFQALEQHVVEPGGAHDLADGKAGKAVEQRPPCATAMTQQEFRVVLEARDEIVDMIAEFGVTAGDVRQIGVGLGGFFQFRRPHRVGVYFVPLISVLAIQSAVMPPMAKTLLSGERP